MTSPSAVRADQNHPTVVAPPHQLQSPLQGGGGAAGTTSPTKSPSKARSFFRSHHHNQEHTTAPNHLTTSIPSPSLNMSASTGGLAGGAGGGGEQTPTDDATLLHIKLKQEAQERAMRTSPHHSSITSPGNRSRHVSGPSGSGGASSSLSYGYDGQNVYTPQDHITSSHNHNTVKGHNRTSSLGATTTTSGSGGAGGGINAGWYMTTGVLPAVIQSPPPGQQDNLSRSGSLGQRSRLSKYGSLYDATGLDRSGTGRTHGTTSQPIDEQQQQQQQQQRYQQKELPQRPISPEYVQNISGLRSQLLDDTADATALNKQQKNLNLKELKQHPHNHKEPHVSVIPTPVRSPPTNEQQHLHQHQQEGSSLPAAVTNAGQTAQHRRNVSMDRNNVNSAATSAPSQSQPEQVLPAQRGTSAGAAAVGTGALENQGRFMEEMDIIGRKSEDVAPSKHQLGSLPVALASTGPSRGDSLKNKNKGAHAILPQQQQQQQGNGLSSYNRGDMIPHSSQTRQENGGNAQSVGTQLLPERMGENLPASEIARQREMRNAYAEQGAREEPRTAAFNSGISDPPTSSRQSVPTHLPMNQQGRQLGQKEVVRTATQGPSYQTTRTSEPKVISSKTQRFLEHPIPNISHPAPNHPQIQDLFSNIAQPIPHYMFVNYTASICQQCVASEQKMYALTHGGEKWRYTYSDPEEEQEIQGDDPNTRKTGREFYHDTVSILGSSTYNKEGKEQCKCEECLKNREIVKYAAENGLIEKIFEGRKHPASELIETITTTTIVRAPIIQETITTIWCEEPNCSQCAIKQKEYEEELRMKELNKAMNGMVIHETGQSDHYSGYKNLLDVNGALGGANSSNGNANQETSTTTTTSTFASEGGKKGIERLLKIAGNPRQEKLRRQPGTKAEFDGHIVGYDDDKVLGKSLEQVEPSHTDMREFVESGAEARL